MKLEVGMYVRTKYGISKIENISPNEYDKEHDYVELETFVFDGLDTQCFFTTDEIIKSNHNLLSLIEVGDIINKKEVVKIIHFEGDTFYRIELFGGKAIMNSKDIKSIVTKEQFESMKYSLEG